MISLAQLSSSTSILHDLASLFIWPEGKTSKGRSMNQALGLSWSFAFMSSQCGASAHRQLYM